MVDEAPMDDDHIRALAPVAPQRSFAAGEVLRPWGAHASDMFVVLEGEVAVEFEDSNRSTVTVGRHQPLGEMGFLTGRPAMARLVATDPVTVLVVDGAVLAALGREDPDMAVRVQRALARTAEARAVANEGMLGQPGPAPDTIEVRRCAGPDSLGMAQSLRYDVFAGEHRRDVPGVDHDNGTVIDGLDARGMTFLALHEGRPVGTARISSGDDPDLGMLPRLLDMPADAQPAARAAVITAQAVRDGYRGGAIHAALFAAMATALKGRAVAAVYLACEPALAEVYAPMGFRRCAADFVHAQTGLATPLRLDLSRRGAETGGDGATDGATSGAGDNAGAGDAPG